MFIPYNQELQKLYTMILGTRYTIIKGKDFLVNIQSLKGHNWLTAVVEREYLATNLKKDLVGSWSDQAWVGEVLHWQNISRHHELGGDVQANLGIIGCTWATLSHGQGECKHIAISEGLNGWNGCDWRNVEHCNDKEANNVAILFKPCICQAKIHWTQIRIADKVVDGECL
ncbi:hypothetical protein CPB84DRAFT_1744117 [Gymnopilus junonius]|uniref:Uncharacterized protein n=1 Tax=Gymnopilus junonius TaxID=109634 RepID=A0A9P5NYJ8_GYMJU|nr:hypothetical protein CPB84DRAFT_1744117 [Gymnopilus junonius]